MKKKRTITKITLLIFVLGIIAPLSLLAADYTYNYSKTGTEITQISDNNYQLTNEKVNFTNLEEVWVFTQLNNLTDFDNFQIRHDVYQNGISLVASLESPNFSPNGSFWDKTQTWNNFGFFPSGSYTIKVMLSIDSGVYAELDSLDITVLGVATEYNYIGSETGIDIDEIASNDFALRTKKSIFTPVENVWIFTELNDVVGVDNFQVKHDLFINGSISPVTLESPIYYPNGYVWEKTQTWNNFGFLPTGDHTIKVSVKINDSVYAENEIVNFTVEGVANEIIHIATLTGVGITEVSDNNFTLATEKSDFSASEEVWVFTELSDITNIDTFQIRYDLYRDQSTNFISKESPEFFPNGNYWDKTSTWHNFGTLPAGTHEFRVYLSKNGEAYEQLDTVVFNVDSTGWLGYEYTGTDITYNYDVREWGWEGYYSELDNDGPDYTVRIKSWLANIYVDQFKWRHRIIDPNGEVGREIDSGTYNVLDNGGYWEENSYSYPVSEYWAATNGIGTYTLEVYLDINDGNGFTLIDTQNFDITG